MASFKSTLFSLVLLMMLFAMVVGVAFGWGWWKQRGIEQDLSLAETRLAEGKPVDAEMLLSSHLDSGNRPSGTWVDKALDLRFRTLTALAESATDPKQKKSYLDSANEKADRVLDPKKPWVSKGQAAWARAHLILAQAALENNKSDAALPHIQALIDTPEGSPGREEAMLDLSRIDMANGDVAKAQKSLQEMMDKLPEDSPVRSKVEYALGLCNMSLLMSLQPQPDDQLYVIQKGDSPDRLRKKFKISSDVLMAINQISDPRKLTIGRRIKIPNLDLSIVVDKSDNTLTLLNHGKFFKKYRVRTGKDPFMTPTGDHRVVNKMASPPWTNPKTNQHFGPEEPGNEIGCRWLAFQGASLGIHEASDPASIGKYSSNGCVGMLHDDVIELYNLVPLFTPVKIVGKTVNTPSMQAPPEPARTPTPVPAAPIAAVAPVSAAGVSAAPAAEAGVDAGATAVATPAAKKKIGARRSPARATKKKKI